MKENFELDNIDFEHFSSLKTDPLTTVINRAYDLNLLVERDVPDIPVLYNIYDTLYNNIIEDITYCHIGRGHRISHYYDIKRDSSSLDDLLKSLREKQNPEDYFRNSIKKERPTLELLLFRYCDTCTFCGVALAYYWEKDHHLLESNIYTLLSTYKCNVEIDLMNRLDELYQLVTSQVYSLIYKEKTPDDFMSDEEESYLFKKAGEIMYKFGIIYQMQRKGHFKHFGNTIKDSESDKQLILNRSQYWDAYQDYFEIIKTALKKCDKSSLQTAFSYLNNLSLEKGYKLDCYSYNPTSESWRSITKVFARKTKAFCFSNKSLMKVSTIDYINLSFNPQSIWQLFLYYMSVNNKQCHILFSFEEIENEYRKAVDYCGGNYIPNSFFEKYKKCGIRTTITIDDDKAFIHAINQVYSNLYIVEVSFIKQGDKTQLLSFSEKEIATIYENRTGTRYNYAPGFIPERMFFP